MLGGTRLIATILSPPTASARLRRSVVVVSTWRRSCANPGEARIPSATTKAKRNAMTSESERPRSCGPFVLLALAGAGDPDALRHHAMDILLGVGDRADAAIHRHAGKRIGVEARELLLRGEQIDHAH